MSEGPKKIHSKNEFELCYLRHQYLRKVKEIPSQEEMRPYKPIASHMAKNTFYMYRNLFHMLGFDVEDVINIANIHLISFLGLFSLEKLPKKYEDFLGAHYLKFLKEPGEGDILNKNKANCTIFIKQRMEDLVRVCRQKARNVKGLPTEEFYFYYGPKRPPRILKNLVENYEQLGFRKLDTAVYKTIKKRLKVSDSTIFKFDGNYYVAVPVDHKILTLSDFSGADLDPYECLHNMTPEQRLFIAESESELSKKKKEFDRKSRHSKMEIVKNFIEKNRKRPEYKEEIRAARKLLKSIGAQVV